MKNIVKILAIGLFAFVFTLNFYITNDNGNCNINYQNIPLEVKASDNEEPKELVNPELLDGHCANCPYGMVRINCSGRGAGCYSDEHCYLGFC
jgi:hypothetical protein